MAQTSSKKEFQKMEKSSDNQSGIKSDRKIKINQIPIDDLFKEYFRKFKSARFIATGLLIVLIPVPFWLGYVCYGIGIPSLLSWTYEKWWHWLPSFFGFLGMGITPIWTIMLWGWLARQLMETSIAIHEEHAKKELAKFKESGNQILEETVNKDRAGLLPLIRYSTGLLEGYYMIGQKQAQRSFQNSVIAMWVGFIFMIFGFSLYVAPLEKMGLSVPDPDFKNVIITIGGIIELIAALFLWVYRNASEQLTYFYDRQIHTHNVVMCHRIAESMGESDESKQFIIDKVLSRNWKPDRTPLKSTEWIKSLVSKSKPKN